MKNPFSKKAPSQQEAFLRTYLDRIAPGVVKFEVDHYIFGSTYRCVWALREYPASTEAQALLRELGEKSGVTLRIPKGSFVVMKTGTHPMQTKLRLFLDWGITFGAPYITPEHASRPVTYASRQELFLRIDRAYGKKNSQPTQVPIAERRSPYSAMGLYNEDAKT